MKTKGFSIQSKVRLLFGVLLGLTLCPTTLFAQITATSASYQSLTEYTTGVQNDIFIFCDAAGLGVGELNAVSSKGTPGWNFTWTKWDEGTSSFSIPVLVENNQSQSSPTDLDDGFYQVVLEKGADVETYRAWVFNHLKSTNQPTLTFDKKDCNAVFFNSSFSPRVYQYLNYPSSDLLDVPNDLTFLFKRGSEEVFPRKFKDYDGSSKNFSDDKAFENEVDYSMTVIDACGFEYVSVIFPSETYVVDPTFTPNPKSGDAPLEVSFEITYDNNNAEYQWYIYKKDSNIPDVDYVVIPEREDLLTDEIFGRDVVYTYMHPGEYFVKLRATNNVDGMNCDKSYILDIPIDVKASLFEVPNVFTPNGDTYNDVFRLRLFSVKSYNAKIFNRWGRLVYEFEESDIQYTNAGYDSAIVGEGSEHWKSVKGWNGKINGKLATSGTYFYVIEAEGREEDGKHYTERGSLTLLHNK